MTLVLVTIVQPRQESIVRSHEHCLVQDTPPNQLTLTFAIAEFGTIGQSRSRKKLGGMDRVLNFCPTHSSAHTPRQHARAQPNCSRFSVADISTGVIPFLILQVLSMLPTTEGPRGRYASTGGPLDAYPPVRRVCWLQVRSTYMVDTEIPWVEWAPQAGRSPSQVSSVRPAVSGSRVVTRERRAALAPPSAIQIGWLSSSF